MTVQVAVKFFSEAGNFELPNTQTPPFSPTPVAGQGSATNTLDTNGSLPEDVDPLPPIGTDPGEPSYDDQCAGVAGHTYNPRDGLVTIIAVFQGEEKFTPDSTGVYHPGNTFTDLPAPFVDSNDNSVWDLGEACEGASTSGVCGGPNGIWDGNANVFVETHVLYSGHANQSTAVCNNCIVSPLQGTTISFLPQNPNQSSMPQMGIATGFINYAEINLNVPALPATNSLVIAGPTSLQLKYPFSPCANVDYLGMNVTPLVSCTDGGVPDDAGNPVPSIICAPTTAITDFSGGFDVCQYQLTNSNTQGTGTHSYTLSATLDVEGNSDTQDYGGLAN